MNLKFLVLASLCATVAFAQEGGEAKQDGPKIVLRDDHKAEARDERLRENGGYIDVIPAGPSITIADARKVPDATVPSRVKGVVNGMLKLAASNEVVKLEEKGCPFSKAVELRKRSKALMVIMLTNCGEDKPALVVFPEERVALVNADRAAQFTTGEDANLRLVKECWRGIGFIGGAGYAMNDASVMQPIGSSLELDTVTWQVVHPTALNQMNKFFRKYGAERGRRTTYLRACEQGWAPAPTNDAQKAIWEKVKAEKEAKAKAEAAKAAPPAPAK